MQSIHRQYQIYVDRPPDAVWRFQTDLSNHPRTSPPRTREQVLRGLNTPLAQGVRIAFRARHGLFLSTLEAEIVEWDPPTQFVDRQVRGPFRSWTHRHTFRPFQNGTLMTDRIEYRVPFGILGLLADRLWLGKHLDRFFAYRQQAAKRLLEKPL